MLLPSRFDRLCGLKPSSCVARQFMMYVYTDSTDDAASIFGSLVPRLQLSPPHAQKCGTNLGSKCHSYS